MIDPKGTWHRLQTNRNAPYLPAANDSNIFKISLDAFDHMKQLIEQYTSSDREMYEAEASSNVSETGGRSK